MKPAGRISRCHRRGSSAGESFGSFCGVADRCGRGGGSSANTICAGCGFAARTIFDLWAGIGHDAEAVHVRINEEPALVMAASPECLTILPSRKTVAGPAKIAIASTITPGEQWKASTTLVALDPEMAGVNPVPGQKVTLKVRVRGSEKRLCVAIENEVPGVLRFPEGDVQEALTSGGPENIATVEAQAIRSGDFSFAAKLLPAPNEELARAYLQAALPLAEQPMQKDLNRLVKELERHPREPGWREARDRRNAEHNDGRRFSHGAGRGANGAVVAPARSGLADYQLSDRYLDFDRQVPSPLRHR